MKKNKLNEFQMTFEAKSENESFARQVVSSFISQLDPTLEELTDIRCAVSEAVTNSIVHAYRGKSGGVVSVQATYFDDRTVVIKIKDKGCGISDIEKCREPLYTTDPSGERGGMGFAIMECFTDKLKITTKLNKGTTVTLYKKLM